jgi:hypothetical protein
MAVGPLGSISAPPRGSSRCQALPSSEQFGDPQSGSGDLPASVLAHSIGGCGGRADSESLFRVIGPLDGA